MEKQRAWVCTFVVQVSLCIALYFSLNLGQPMSSLYLRSGGTANTRPLDVYFLSVKGGFRDIKQQTHLLKLVNF